MPLTNEEKRRYYESRGYIFDEEPSERQIERNFRLAVVHHKREEREVWARYYAATMKPMTNGATLEDGKALTIWYAPSSDSIDQADKGLAAYRDKFGTYPEET